MVSTRFPRLAHAGSAVKSDMHSTRSSRLSCFRTRLFDCRLCSVFEWRRLRWHDWVWRCRHDDDGWRRLGWLN